MNDKRFIKANRLLEKQEWSLQIFSSAKAEVSKRWRKSLNFSGADTFIDRSKGQKRLLIILAGYKSFLWPLTLARIATFVPSDIDVCIVSSGLYSAPLAELATAYGWSYLYTKVNKVGVVQNLAIARHTKAKWIYKLDEDIFISKNFFQQLLDGYLRIKKERLYNPGFCSPVINVNGYSYIVFLKIINSEHEYRAKFHELKHAAEGVKAHYDGESAKWLWAKSLPFDKIAHYLSSQPFEYSAAPHRFNIGAILFERDFWEAVGGLRSPLIGSGLGVDEEHLCKDCIGMSRPMLVIHNAFAGHFSFGPQEASMKEYLPEIYPQLSLKGSETNEI